MVCVFGRLRELATLILEQGQLQRDLEPKREEWRRFQYVAELALDENNERRANIGVLIVLKMVLTVKTWGGSVMTDSIPQGAVRVSDARINAARTKLIIDKKLKRASKPQIERLAQLKTSGERRLIAS